MDTFPTQNCVVLHYGEIALKGKNRSFFEKKLLRNLKRALRNTGEYRIERLRGRFVIHLPERYPKDDIEKALRKVFGIAHFGFSLAIPKDLAAIKQATWDLMKDIEFDSFKIDSRRGQKEFPYTSVELNREVGAYVQERCNKRVDLNNAQCTGHIEIAGPYALVYTRKLPGLRGLPVGTSESAVCLLSSGIDSPVASFMMLKRGVNLIYTHFHSQPFTSEASQENTERIIGILNEYQYRAKAYFIPFIEIQKQIMTHAPPGLRVLLYRRYMVRLAERVAAMEGATALVTGENVGQVASQTLSNIRVVAEVSQLPILRPLAGFDKEEIVEKAKRIGTFEISTQPYEDCCSLFVPQNPETKGRSQDLQRAEQILNIDELLDETLENSQVKIFDIRKREAITNKEGRC